MTAGAPWLVWLGETPWSMALRESVWAYPIVATVHVVALLGFTGVAFMWDLRLLGAGIIDVPVAALWQRASRMLWVAFSVTAASGLLLFAADPVRFAGNRCFQGKLVLLVLAGVNVVIFHVRQGHLLAQREASAAPGVAARAGALASLLAWACIVVAGRLIAFAAP